jgi:hypothetical protein
MSLLQDFAAAAMITVGLIGGQAEVFNSCKPVSTQVGPAPASGSDYPSEARTLSYRALVGAGELLALLPRRQALKRLLRNPAAPVPK